MKITNIHDLPVPIVDACTNFIRKPPPGKISATELIGPPAIRILKKQHWDELVVDVSEMIWSLLGSAVHAILEKADTTNHLSEERLFAEVEGWKISGQPDLWHPDGTLTDYKVTSVYAATHEKVEWDKQQNVYRWLFQQIGFETKRMEIVAILRDWQKSKSEKDADYPQVQVLKRVIPVMDGIQDYITDRVILHQQAEYHDCQPCTPEERWHRNDAWAVMRKGRKRAVRVFNNFSDVEEWMKGEDDKASIQFRPGRDVRCESYCPVRAVCPYKNVPVMSEQAEEPS